ncbi:MAG: type II secretion system protein GspG, partial [Candidatus Hydrogenedentes bacterium]|nr:type II secretion system protein GspG [Candidatus Hydrogenedentota bacterium]
DVETVPKDPWGNAYLYKCPGDNGRDFDIVSLGADGSAGGEGENADVQSWNLQQQS